MHTLFSLSAACQRAQTFPRDDGVCSLPQWADNSALELAHLHAHTFAECSKIGEDTGPIFRQLFTVKTRLGNTTLRNTLSFQ